jgi:hypothetical protein
VNGFSQDAALAAGEVVPEEEGPPPAGGILGPLLAAPGTAGSAHGTAGARDDIDDALVVGTETALAAPGADDEELGAGDDPDAGEVSGAFDAPLFGVVVPRSRASELESVRRGSPVSDRLGRSARLRPALGSTVEISERSTK